jgi:crossover junction endodeoxyribonuclease RuvC
LQNNRRILGIDPGTQVTGVGIIEIGLSGVITHCYHGSIKTNRKASLAYRLKEIYSGIRDIMERFKPDEVALEDIFYSENIKTAIVMGHARGVALLAPMQLGVAPAEYSPREVKLAVVGNGGASKGQVKFMVENILKLHAKIESQDAADALAVAICHFHRMKQ